MTTETSIYEYAKQGLFVSENKPAIWYYGESISYKELFEKIDNLANHLYRFGVREGTVVTIHLPNCPQAVMAIYAVSKLGGICNMVHPQIPKASLAAILKTVDCHIVFTYQSDCLSLSELGFFIHSTGYGSESVKSENSFVALTEPNEIEAIFPEPSSLAEKCAVFFHSSGTTGQPKTVMQCHRALNSQADKIRKFYKVEDLNRQLPVILNVFPFFHGAGFGSDLHEALSGGSELVMLSQWDPAFAASVIDSKSVAFMSGVPTVFESLLSNSQFSGKSLKLCAVAGEGVSKELKMAFKKRTGAALVEGYGMTENVAACCSESRFEENGKGMLPYPGCKIAVLTENGLSFIGEGELLVSSDTLMLGYLGGDCQTSDSFITADNDRWFCTGDQGRITENGRIFFLHRIKNVIISKGYNVYPDEIDAITKEAEAVDSACTVGLSPGNGRTEAVVCFVVLKNGTDKKTALETIQKLWKEKLPTYSIPRKIMILDHMPLNSVGKIDRKKLESIPWEKN